MVTENHDRYQNCTVHQESQAAQLIYDREVSAVIESYLLNCWKWAAKKRELFSDCELVIETLPAISYCEDCKESYSTLQHGKICPNCGSEHTYLLQGNEFIIKEIEVE